MSPIPWFKVDDKLHDHRKARAAGPSAMGVWLMAGSWSAANLTDGFIPSAILPRWGRQREATRLVEVGLWFADEQDGETGWRFHQWAEFQPTRAEKLAEREERAKAGKRGGAASGRSRREAKSKQSASGLLEPPSRPVPTRPDPTTDANASVSRAERFEEWWNTYDHKVGRKKAEAAYRQALKKTTPDVLIVAAGEYVAWVKSEGKHPQYTKHPTTWLNGEHWTDERSARQTPPTRVQQHLALAQKLADDENGQARGELT